MACPYFYPVARFETSGWAVPPRLPLGDAFSGECRAPGDTFQPEETHVRQICNLGNGRGVCEHFPAAEGTDAVRFHVAADSAQLIRIQYVFEQDCWPREHGVFEYSIAAHDLTSGPAGAILRRQASAFLESYLRRRS
jgi:hypothetical protein